MFLSNWLVFKIVLAAVTGLVDYPLAGDFELKYDTANKIYLSGGSLEYVSNVVLYKGETSYEIEGPNVIVSDEQKITSSDNTSGDQFGFPVSIYGDYAVCGATWDDTLRKGSAFIFKREGTTWIQQSKIVKDGTRSDSDHFGWSVAISGDYVISGMIGNDTGGNNAGAAYIFKRFGTSWVQMQELLGTTRVTNHRFGGCVSIDGEYAIVGMHYEDNFKGHASIFKRTGETWTEQIELESDDGDTTDRFAISVSIYGNYAIVGASNDNDNGSGSGSAYIYGLNGSSWSLQQKIIADDGVANDSFGWSVAINGDYALVGAYGHAGAGCAYIFKRDGTSWTQQAKLTSSDIEASDSFGQYVALKDDIAVISSPNEDPNNVSNAGSVYIFKRNGTKWIQQTKLTASDAAASDNFGTSVAVSDTDLIVGARNIESSYIYPLKQVTNYYITQPGTYRADLQICGIDYKTNEVEVTGTPSDIEVFTEPETDFTASKAVLSSTSSISYHQGGMSDNGEYYYYGQQVYKKDTGSFTYTTYGSALSTTIFEGSWSSISHDGNYIVSYYTNSTYQLHIIKNNGSTFVNHQTITSPNVSAQSQSQPQFIPGPLKHFVWVERVANTTNVTFHFYKYNSSTDNWALDFSVTNPTGLTTSSTGYWGRGGISFSKDGNYLAVSYNSNPGAAVFKVDWENQTLTLKYQNSESGYFACFLSRDAKYFYYSTGTGTTAGKMLYSANGDWESTPTDVTSSFTNIGNLGDHTSVFSGRYIFSEKGGSARYIFKWNDLISPTLTFDNYNKLSLTNTPTYTSSKLTYGSNVYDIGTLTSDITIEKQGEYASLTFDTSSNVAYFSNVTVGTVLDAPATRAFFHGNFVDTFSDGDVTTAASNGRFYADMSETTTAFGTVSVTSSTSTSTTYQVVVPTELTGTNVLIVGGGGGGGTGSGWPTGGGGGEVQNLTNQTISAGTYTIVVGNGGGTNASGTNSSALGTTANPGTSASNNGGTSGSGNGPGSNYGQYERGGGGGDASVGGGASNRLGGNGGDGSNVSWLDGSVYGEQVSGQAYFGGGGYSGDSNGSNTNGKGSGVAGTGGGGTLGGIGRSGVVAIYSSVGLGVKYIDFDTYNKLSLSGITNPTSKIHALPTGAESTTTYDIGSATNIYIESEGTYTAEMKGASAFALDSNVVSGTISFPSRTSYRYLALAFPRNNFENSMQNMIIEFDDGTKFDNANQPANSAFTQNYAPSTGATTDVFSTSQHNVWSGSSLGWSAGTWYCPFHIDCGSDFTKKVKRVTIINRISDYQYSLIAPRLYGASSVPSTPGLAANWNYVCHVESIQNGWTSTLTSYDMEPKAYRYIGLVGYRTKFTMHIYEFSIELVDGTVYDGSNIPTVSSNMTISSGSAANTIDGDFTSRANWNSGSTYTSASQQYVYLKVDLGSAKKVKHVRVWSNYVGSYENGTNSMNYYGSSTNTSSVNAEGSSDWNRLGPIEMLKSNDTTEQTINSSLYDSKLEFDGYNKLSLNKFDPTSSTLKYGSNTYDLGTISNVYIAYPGTYSAEIKGATNFALSSNVVNQIKLPDVVTVDWSTTSISSITASNGDTLTTNVGGTWDVQTDSTMGKMVHIQTATTSRKFEIENSTQSLTSFVGTGDGVTISFYMKPGNRLYGSPKWFNDLFRVTGNASVVPNVYAQVTYDTGQTYSVTNDEWMYVQISYKWDGSNFVDYTFYIIDENGDQEVKVSKSNVTTNNGLQSSNKFWETNNKWFNMEVASFRGDINLDFYLTNFRFENKYRSESYWKGVPPSTTGSGLPSLTFDTYNKLTFTGLESGSTSNVTFDGNTYSIGTASNVYIENTGTYEAESKGTTTFALTSKAATIDTTVLEIAFHHGAFSASDYSGAYSTVEAAATAGRVYSDTSTTPAYTWGTLNSVDTSTTGQTGYTWTPTSAITADVLMVAGGGGGGGRDGGGGGAGGLIFNASQTLSGQKTIVVGDGGIGGIGHDGTTRPAESGVSGTNTSFTGFDTAVGGGGGAMQTVSSGGSGGGGGISSTTGGNGTSGQGNNGGSYIYPCAGGGGGAGGVGTNATTTKGGDGGVGLNYTSYFGTSYGDSGWFASGGGGGTRGMTVGSASAGGGGNGTLDGTGKAGDGDSHTGGGGGGGGWGGSSSLDIHGGDGGSGIVIIRSGPSATPPSLTHDGYNKLSIQNITPTSTTLKYGSNTYEIGTATNIYVENTGAYTAEIGNATDFALTSNTVSGTIKTVEPTLSGGYFFGHALTYDGKLYGWGENSNGELGVGDNTDKTVPTLCTGIPQGEVVSIWNKSKRSQNQWAKTRDGKIWVTGEGTQYNIPGQTSNQTSFIDVTSYFGDQSLTANNITHISGHGVRTVAALTETGNVWTWGTHNSSMWNLGQGTGASSSNTPKQITFGGVTDNITRFEIGNAHGVALDTDGDVWFWGQIWANGAGVDYPQTTLSDAQKSPHEIMTSNNIIGVSSTYFTIYAWQSDGTYYALGQDSAGQIGDGTATAGGHTSWQKVDYFSANNITINEIYGGAYHVFADTSDGYYCWGGGTHGNFGNGSTGDLESPTKWTNVSNIKVFSSGSYECPYAITEDGKYYAWGNGTNNARGDNTTGDITYPKYIDTLPNILAPSFEFDGYDKVFVNNPLDRVLAPSTIPLDSAFGGTWVTSGWSVDAMTHTSTDFIYKPTGGDSGNSFKCNKTTFVWADNSTGGTPSSVTTHGGYVYCADGYDNSGNYNASNFTTLRGRFLDPFYGMSSINTKYTKDTHTYDTNQAQIVTVSDPGTYDAQIKSGTDFTLKSATIPATKATGLYTWAFHHGNFDNAYGDGDILTARENGRFYADTPAFTGDIGTITPNPNINSYTYTVSFKVINQSGTTIYDGTDGSIQFTMTEGVEYDTRTDLSTTLDDAIDTALSGGSGDWTAHGFQITSSTGFICHHAGTAYDTHTYTLGILKTFHSHSGGSVSVLITNPYYNQTTYTFTPASALTANVLMVAGGGGGGQTSGGSAGGGGAGGLLYYANQSITIGTKTIVVGNGGANHVNGNDTTFTLLTTTFGGGRGATAGETGGNGGSGGGTSHHYPTSPGTGVSDQGNAGGNAGNNTYRTGGGGGGAGGVGGNASTSSQLGGVGGIGLNYSSTFGSFYGESGWFAGGGAGCSQSTATPAVGGTGGGGYSSTAVATANALSGQSHTGGGGGGAGGKGGSGIVLLQTNVATPNANSEVKIPEPHCHVLIEKPDDTQFSHLPSLGNNNVHASGSIVPNIPRADGSVSNVYYSTSTGYFVAAQAGSLVSTVEGIFYPIQQERYDNILEIGHNSTNDVELEMAADGTAKLYRNNGGNELASGTVKCFTAGKWHHIALTLDTNRNAVGYVNGYPVVSTTYASAKLPLDREQMCLYRTGVTATFRKFLMYYFKTYNSVLNHKQILKLAGAAGLGPKLEYDGLNAINVMNTEPGSGTEITIYESNVNDTSNLYVVSCNESSYLLSNAGTYYAQIKGTDTFTITRPLTVTDDHFPLYQYPPIDGTTSGLTSSTTSATWTISGVQYSTESSVAGSPYNTFDNSITSGFDSTSSTGDITITFQSAKTIRKYIIWPYDSTSPVSTPGGNTDPTLSTDGTFRPKSWTVYGTNNLNDWSTVLDTVTNQPPSIYGDVHSISSPASYQYYKLSVTANNGGSGLKIGEWQLWGDA